MALCRVPTSGPAHSEESSTVEPPNQYPALAVAGSSPQYWGAAARYGLHLQSAVPAFVRKEGRVLRSAQPSRTTLCTFWDWYPRGRK